MDQMTTVNDQIRYNFSAPDEIRKCDRMKVKNAQLIQVYFWI